MWRTKIKPQQRINYDITASEVFLIGEQGKAYGKVSRDQALYLAYDQGLDLIEINSQIQPPVCKLIDYGKYLYEKSKQIQKQKAKQKSSEIKEIKLSINIGQHDLEVKEKQAERFFQDGDKVKVFLILRGRELAFVNKAYQIINKFKEDLQAEFEQSIGRQGSRFSALLIKRK